MCALSTKGTVMLVRMNSSTAGEMVMFAEHVRRLFDIIGKECTARGVFTCEQLPEAITRLKEAVAEENLALKAAERQAHEEGLEPEDEAVEDEEYRSGAGIHLGQRAAPFIHLMEWTLKEKGFILWEAAHDF